MGLNSYRHAFFYAIDFEAGYGMVKKKHVASYLIPTARRSGRFKAESEMAYFAVFFTIFKLLFLLRIKELGQSVAGKLVAKCLNKKSTYSKSINSHLLPI